MNTPNRDFMLIFWHMEHDSQRSHPKVLPNQHICRPLQPPYQPVIWLWLTLSNYVTSSLGHESLRRFHPPVFRFMMESDPLGNRWLDLSGATVHEDSPDSFPITSAKICGVLQISTPPNANISIRFSRTCSVWYKRTEVKKHPPRKPDGPFMIG